MHEHSDRPPHTYDRVAALYFVAAGLIDVEQEGRQRLYRLRRDRLDGIVGAWLSNVGPPPKA